MLTSLLKKLFRDAPAEVDGWLARATALQREGRFAEAAAVCEARLTRKPADADALQALAAAFFGQGRSAEGLARLQEAAAVAPHDAALHATLGRVLAAMGQIDAAIASYREAVALRPGSGDAAEDLVGLLKVRRLWDEAEECCHSALRCDPRNVQFRKELGDVLFEQGRVDEAIVELRAAVALAQDDPAIHSDLLRMLSYSGSVTPVEVLAEHRAWAERHARALELAAPPHLNEPNPARRLRVGYVSPWFRKHAVTFFLESVIEHRDAGNFQVFLYADVADPDEYSRRLQGYGVEWRKTVGMSDEQLATAVREDAIDILVDLTGHTRQNRLLAFARRAAPIQANWLGFPCTTGLTSIDYRITDAYCDPPGLTEHLNSEKLARMPGIYMAWRPPEQAPEVGPLPATGNGYVTFGSFGSCFKITPGLVALWSRILARVPQSRLMLLAIDGDVARRRIRDLFTGHGIEAERLEFVQRLTFDEYLAAHGRADIALDTFPYHGATTTCACLWMGLPVVVLAGESHASRADVSMLSHVGLPQFVARTGDEYVEIAARTAADLSGLAALRRELRGMMAQSPNTDAGGCARNLESLFREMWTSWCAARAARVSVR